MRLRFGSATLAATAVLACGRSAPTKSEPTLTASVPVPPWPRTVTELLNDYARTTKCSDRGPLILNPAANLPLIAQRNPDDRCGFKILNIDLQDCVKSDPGNPKANCGASVQREDDQGRPIVSPYCLKGTADGLRIDWKCSVGYNPMTVAAFRAKAPADAVPFRVMGKLADSYYGAFRGSRKTHYALQLRDEADGGLYGYLSRSSPDAPRIFDALQDGGWKYLHVSVKIVDPDHPDEVQIVKLLGSNGWSESADGL